MLCIRQHWQNIWTGRTPGKVPDSSKVHSDHAEHKQAIPDPMQSSIARRCKKIQEALRGRQPSLWLQTSDRTEPDFFCCLRDPNTSNQAGSSRIDFCAHPILHLAAEHPENSRLLANIFIYKHLNRCPLCIYIYMIIIYIYIHVYSILNDLIVMITTEQVPNFYSLLTSLFPLFYRCL